MVLQWYDLYIIEGFCFDVNALLGQTHFKSNPI